MTTPTKDEAIVMLRKSLEGMLFNAHVAGVWNDAVKAINATAHISEEQATKCAVHDNVPMTMNCLACFVEEVIPEIKGVVSEEQASAQEPFGYWFGREYRFISPADRAAFFDSAEAASMLFPLFTHPSQDAVDAVRYRWLTEDHANKDVRDKCHKILSRMDIISYSAASVEIDAAIAQSNAQK